MLHDFLVLDILSINNKSIPLWLLVTISSESQHFYLEELIWQSPLVDNIEQIPIPWWTSCGYSLYKPWYKLIKARLILLLKGL